MGWKAISVSDKVPYRILSLSLLTSHTQNMAWVFLGKPRPCFGYGTSGERAREFDMGPCLRLRLPSIPFMHFQPLPAKHRTPDPRHPSIHRAHTSLILCVLMSCVCSYEVSMSDIQVRCPVFMYVVIVRCFGTWYVVHVCVRA